MSLHHHLVSSFSTEYLRSNIVPDTAARHTSVPVPKVHCAFVHQGETYIVMSRIKGRVVWHGWLGRSHDSKTRILEQLRQMLAELRSVPQPAGVGVSNVIGGPLCDCRLPSKMLWGPGLGNDLVLTHGDLSSFNIMIQGDEVTGIVDWETAGWFPPYWEYTCARNANPQNAFWAQEVDRFLPPRPHELRMDGIRRKHLGDF
ncbi:phosphotransferase enzyme family protein [Hirsutella rhossiliensis]|uniref:Phosphotransferase enzyme family domain-containing protein n=1 Tax=Hirsutella rhossiliensis TaxID=111463 RepID=A0A9P8SIR5_9HYPO|nr:phosphotransferase enzyme family domain-containing protein [Hirsutella rhossiliensis]KAH0962900.1 phosphotransferase enzyme family domain-containing protein [Hirsutella rhossiliensis]